MELNNENIYEIAIEITKGLKNWSKFINIQIEQEGGQYDILFSADYKSVGYHQCGLKNNYLLIGIVGLGLHGFRIDSEANTYESYYNKKLGVYSPLLTKLFNQIRKDLANWTVLNQEVKENEKK